MGFIGRAADAHGEKLSRRYIPVGAVVGTHGIAGWLKLKPFDPSSTILLSAREISIAYGSHSESYTLDQAKPHKRIVLLKLRDIDKIETAERFVGREVSLPEDALEPLRDNEYYYLDVLGLDVFDTKGSYLGKITRVWFNEGSHLYVVGDDRKEHLIPAAKEIIEKVDLINRRVIVDLPEGLLDL